MPEEASVGMPGKRAEEALLRAAQVIWERKLLLILGVAVGLMLGTLYYVVTPRIYRSSAQVLVVKKRPDELTGVTSRYVPIEDFVSTHQTLITSPVIVGRAVEKHSLGSLRTFSGWEEKLAAGGDDLPAAIKKGMTVSRNRGSGSAGNNILELSFQGGVAEECHTVVDAVLASYKDFLDETYRNMSDDTLELVTRARDLLEKDLARKESAYREFREKSPFLSAKGREGPDVRQEGLATIQVKKSALLLRRAELQGQLAAVEEARKEGRSKDAVLAMLLEFSRRGGDESAAEKSLNLEEQLLPLLAEEQRLLSSYGPNHSEVRAIRRRIETAREVLTRPTGVLAGKEPQPEKAGAAPDPVAVHVEHLKQKLAYVETAEQFLADAFGKQHLEAKTLAKYEIQDEMLRAEITRTQQLYDGIVKRLQDVSLVKDVGGYDARVISPPAIGRKVAPSGLVVFPVALVLGGLAGLGLVYLSEITDQSFRAPEEVGRRLRLPVVGYIPKLTRRDRPGATPVGAGAAPLDESLFAYHRPRSREAEAYRGVRTALYFGTRGNRNQVIQVTSPNLGDGKSTLASNLGISIAQSGKRVVLVDADLRRPRLHTLFGLPNEQGLVSALVEEIDVAELTCASGVPNLAVLPCGPLPPNPSELLTSARFRELLDSLRGRYDFVIVDTPPLLAVTDASVVAPNVDGVILTVRMVRNARPTAERARHILTTLGATVLGVAVNEVSGRGTAVYGYGYSGYGEGEDDRGSTPQAPEEPAAAVAVTGSATEAAGVTGNGVASFPGTKPGHSGT